MVSVDMCEHGWPGSGCKQCKQEAAAEKDSIVAEAMRKTTHMNPFRRASDEINHLLATLAERDAEIAALKAERAWRPIESAPRDGTRVLVYAPPPDPAKWHGSTLGSLICTVEYHADGGWCVCEIREATRWQPLPPAPEAT